MLDFYLHQYNSNLGIITSLASPHLYRTPAIKMLSRQSECLTAWERDKIKIAEKFISRLLEVYGKDESFLLFTPASMNRMFVDTIIDHIKHEFLNVIDMTSIFRKKENVSFGESKFDNYSVAQLADFIEVMNSPLETVPENLNKAFIVDDVFSTGKSIEVTKYLILQTFGKDCEIKSGVIVKTT